MDDASCYVLDTSALLTHLRAEPGADIVQRLLEDDSARILIVSATITEFRRTVRALGFPETLADQTLADYMLLADGALPIGVDEALRADRIAAETPERLPLVDALISGAASVARATLVHRDAHMARIPADLVAQKMLAKA